MAHSNVALDVLCSPSRALVPKQPGRIALCFTFHHLLLKLYIPPFYHNHSVSAVAFDSTPIEKLRDVCRSGGRRNNY